jgi:hypothetical protein
MLTYKAELVGIRVRLTEERDTSKASCLATDLLPSSWVWCSRYPSVQWAARAARALASSEWVTHDA